MKDASCKPCPASFPQIQMEAPHTPGGRLEVLNFLLLLFFHVAPSPCTAAFRGKTVTIVQFIGCLNEHSFLQSGLVSIYPFTWFSDVLYPADLQDMLLTQNSPGVRLLLGALHCSCQPARGIKQCWQQNRDKCVGAGLLPVSNKKYCTSLLPPLWKLLHQHEFPALVDQIWAVFCESCSLP